VREAVAESVLEAVAAEKSAAEAELSVREAVELVESVREGVAASLLEAVRRSV